MVIPGLELLSQNLLAFAYCLMLIYLFLGIQIIADLFMEAIEVITSTV